MLNLPIFGKKKLILAFEYGMIFASCAKDQGMELTPELSLRFEEMLWNEFKTKSSEQLAVDMLPNILSVFETTLDK